MIRGRFLFPLMVALLALAAWIPGTGLSASPDGRDGNTAAPKPPAKEQRVVYTNEMLENLGNNPPAAAASEAPPTAPPAPEAERPASPASRGMLAQLQPYVKEKDPNWYLAQLAPLRAEVARIENEIVRLHDFRATGSGMMDGLVLNLPSMRLTPENEIEQLGVRRQELEQRIDDLEHTARRNDISPGFLLPSSPYVAPAAPVRLLLTSAEVDELGRQRDEVEAQLAEEETHLAFARKELEFARRDSLLFRQQFYSNPDYARDSKGEAQLAALASLAAAKREEVNATQEQIAALQEKLQTLSHVLGPKPAEPLTLEQQRKIWEERLRPLQEELSSVAAQLAGMRSATAAQGLTLYPEDSSGSPTSVLLKRLETRANSLRLQIESMEEEARQAGAPPGWFR